MFCSEQKALIVNHFLGDKLLCATTDELIESYAPQGEGMVQQQKNAWYGHDELSVVIAFLWNGY